MAFNTSNNNTCYQRLINSSVSKDVLDHVSDYFNSVRLANPVPEPNTWIYQEQHAQARSNSGSAIATNVTSPALSMGGWSIFSPPMIPSLATSSMSSANTSHSNISTTAVGLNAEQSDTDSSSSPSKVALRFSNQLTLSTMSRQPPVKPVCFNQYLNITKSHKGALTVSHSTHNGISFHDCTSTKFLFHRQNMTPLSKCRKFILYNGDDSIDPIIAFSKSLLVKSSGARNQVRTDLTSRPNTSFELNAMYLEGEVYSRSFTFQLPGTRKASRFVWKNSKYSIAVKALDKKTSGLGMKLVNSETREVVMGYVKPGRWEKVKSRSGKMEARVGFMGNRYGAEFKSLAFFSLLIMIDLKWDY